MCTLSLALFGLGWATLCKCVLSCWGVTVLLIAKGKHPAVLGWERALASLELSIEKCGVVRQILKNNSVLIIHLPTELLEVEALGCRSQCCSTGLLCAAAASG